MMEMQSKDGRPSRSNIEAVLWSALAENHKRDVTSVRADIGEFGEVDSLEGVELIARAEETFGVSIADAEVAQVCRSIPRLVDLVETKMQQRQQEEARS